MPRMASALKGSRLPHDGAVREHQVEPVLQRRLIQTTIEDQLADEVLAGRITEGDTVTFDVEDGIDRLTSSRVRSLPRSDKPGSREQALLTPKRCAWSPRMRCWSLC